VVLLMFLVLAPLGILGARIVFAHLAVVGQVLTFFRSRMQESVLWASAQKAETIARERRRLTGRAARSAWRQLLTPRHVRSMVFLIAMYGLWNLWAGTNGFFFLRIVGAQTQAASVALQALGFALSMASLGLVFMRFSDRVNQRVLVITSAGIQMLGMALLRCFP
jgi:inositol transporter-like SP family MFS transporter